MIAYLKHQNRVWANMETAAWWFVSIILILFFITFCRGVFKHHDNYIREKYHDECERMAEELERQEAEKEKRDAAKDYHKGKM